MKLGVFIGRCQPLHDGHVACIKAMLDSMDKGIVLLGSANAMPSVKNPFTFSDRKSLITLRFVEYLDKLVILPLNDYRYDDAAWVGDVDMIIDKYSDDATSVHIFGHKKEGNFYLDWFPDAEFHNIDAVSDNTGTLIRNQLFEQRDESIPATVLLDYDYAKSEALLFANYPYPETLSFQCSDMVVSSAGHILLVNRGSSPGIETWALPGGFKNANESFVDCGIRELREETGLDIMKVNCKINNAVLFDSPDRSSNGCIPRVTMVYHVVGEDMSDVVGGDDAITANWFSFHDVMNNLVMYDDHRDIISILLQIRPAPAHLNKVFNDA